MVKNLIGVNVVVKNRIAQIRYHGPVDGKQGTYYGLEWHDREGKHSGLGYFETRYEDSASFISDLANVDFGTSFYDALVEKYTVGLDRNSENIVIGNKVVELIGVQSIESKLCDLENLQIVGLSGKRINGRVVDNIAGLGLQIQELDLSRNLFNSFQDVANITQHLIKLYLLRLNHNWLVCDLKSVINVRILCVSNCKLDWNEFVKMAGHMPNLEELYFGGNEVERILECPLKLKVLDLEDNMIRDLRDIRGLFDGTISAINLKRNLISQIPLFCKDDLRELKSLNLAYNRLNNWMCINNLNNLSLLTNIRLNNNPITEKLEPEILVGRLRNVSVLSGCQVTAKIREDSELYYLKAAHKDLSKTDFCSLHPRYSELCQIHGTPITEKGNFLLADRLVSITIGTKTKRLPKTMTVRALKTMFRAKRLAYQGVELLDNKQIAYYDLDQVATLEVL